MRHKMCLGIEEWRLQNLSKRAQRQARTHLKKFAMRTFVEEGVRAVSTTSAVVFKSFLRFFLYPSSECTCCSDPLVSARTHCTCMLPRTGALE